MLTSGFNNSSSSTGKPRLSNTYYIKGESALSTIYVVLGLMLVISERYVYPDTTFMVKIREAKGNCEKVRKAEGRGKER